MPDNPTAWVMFVPIFWPITIPLLIVHKVSDYFFLRRNKEDIRVKKATKDLAEGRRTARLREHQAYCRGIGLQCSDEDAAAYVDSAPGDVSVAAAGSGR